MWHSSCYNSSMSSKWMLAIAVVIAISGGSVQAREGAISLAWSRKPPGGLDPKKIPQFVSITFDDNFGSAFPNATGGISYILDFYNSRKNPAGTGNSQNFDGTPIKASFYFTSIYLVDDSKKALGGKPGEDHAGHNRAAWSATFRDGHEAGDHTVNHFNGGVVPLDPDDCCRARNFSVAQWTAEIKSCRDTLTGVEGIGARPADVIGFRTPYLGYNDNLYTALSNLKFQYDTSLPNCFDDSEDGGNCSWPYTLDHGSPDMEVVSRKFSTPNAKIPITFPKVTSHEGLWELPPATLIIPPDGVAAKYGFTPGLRDRIAKKGTLPYPSIYEASTGKIAGLDYTLLMDAGLTGAEMSAVLKYNLDLHLAGNRSPLVFIAHSHLYSYSSAKDNPDTPTAADRDARWKGLTDFITYALGKPEVRIIAAKDLLAWVQRAAAVPETAK
jgi:peptidoglycan/xylan/chitin deacetylase (PgdA/CDA1 family)